MGDPGTGKSFVCLNVAREAQKKGYDVIYCDTEGAIDKSTTDKFGIDSGRVRYQPIKTVTEFQTFVSNLLDLVKKARASGAQPKILLILDSLGMLSTDKELRDAIEGKNAADMGAKAKELRKLFRVITLDLTQAKIPLVCTNHVYAGGGYIPTKESSGGDGPIFAMSVISFLSKAQLKEGNSTTKTGIIVTSNLKKSRFTIPEPVKFHISFLNGMNPYVGLQDFVSWEACGIGKGKYDTKLDSNNNIIADKYVLLSAMKLGEIPVRSNKLFDICDYATRDGHSKNTFWAFDGQVIIDFDEKDFIKWHLKNNNIFDFEPTHLSYV
jgi:RecA/RadA recombinase